MKRWMKVTVIALGVLALGVGGLVSAGLQLAQTRMQRQVEVIARAVAPRTDAASLERGRYLFASRGCVDCHGANGAGRTFLDDGKGLRLAGPNISPGPGSVVAAYQPADWERAIRHGVKPNGQPMMIMPSEDYNRFTDDDLAALVGHVRSLPPAPGGPAVLELPLPARVLYGLGLMKDAAAKIDHALAPAQPVPEGVTATHGAYVANMCLGCHGANLAGGRIPGGPPDWPAAANLTPGEGTVMAGYRDAEALIKLFRTGQRADGSKVRVMPFESLREMSETDMRALHLYLQTLKPLPRG